jgi:hypothetical protein
MGMVSCVTDRGIDMNGIGIQSEKTLCILSATVDMNRLTCFDRHLWIYRLGVSPPTPLTLELDMANRQTQKKNDPTVPTAWCRPT